MDDDIREKVKEGYGKIARGEGTHYTSGSSCCGGSDPAGLSMMVGYSEDEIGSVPEGSNLGLGCGNPVSLATLSKGETVLDLGSGAGFDCFLAASRVGPEGRVIGVDMTFDMVQKARENAMRSNIQNVDFRHGFIEELPVDDHEVNVVISNCVINLSPDKDKVFTEAFRVLSEGGRLMVSDLVFTGKVPPEIRSSVSAHISCIAGADHRDEFLERIKKAGFSEVSIVSEDEFPIDCISDITSLESIMDETGLEMKELSSVLSVVRSVKVHAVK
jgi:SAM-dependent methyltransferase